MEKINYKDLKKNDRIKSNQIGVPITGKLMESPKQGKGLKKVIGCHDYEIMHFALEKERDSYRKSYLNNK
jgi:hypothetical protein